MDNAREQLLRFLDRKAFDPVLEAKPDRFDDKDRQALADAQARTRRTKGRYHDDYGSANEIRQQFLSDVSSQAAQKVDRELERLGLPTLPKLHDEFLQLCERLGVGPSERPSA